MPKKIEKRSNGSYRLNVANGYDSEGRQKIMRKTIHAANDKEAKEAYREFEAEVRQGKILYSNKITLYDFAKKWMKDFVEPELAPKTQRSYRNHLKYRILPAMGHLDIKSIRPVHILEFKNKLTQGGKRFDGRSGSLSDQTVMYCYRVLSSMLKDAVEWQVIAENPCEKVKAPKVMRHAPLRFDEPGVGKMMEALEKTKSPYSTIAQLAVYTGCRLGELMALKWEDIDMENAIIHITKSLQAEKGKGVFIKETKNASSTRQIAASPKTIDLLKAHRATQDAQKMEAGDQYVDRGWIFADKNGKCFYPTTPSHWFHKFLHRKGLPLIRFHDLRHLSATILLTQGLPEKSVSARLGHGDIRTTANIYGSALRSVDRQAANSLDEAIGKLVQEDKAK